MQNSPMPGKTVRFLRSALVLAVLLSGLFLTPATAAGEVHLGVILAETGLALDDSLPASRGALIALEQINRNGGLLGHPLRATFIDNSSTPIGAKTAAVKALEYGVHGVVGAIWSSQSLAMARVLQQAGIPMISPGSTQPAVTRTGDYIFRVCCIDSFQGNILARFATEELGCRNVVVMTNINESYSVTLADYFIKNFRLYGGKVLWEGKYRGVSVDFASLLNEIRSLDMDSIFIPGYSRDSGLMVRQAVKLGIDPVFLGGDAWDGPIETYAGETLDGSFFSTHWHPDISFPESRAFIREYREKYPEESIISPFAPLTYDAVMLFADAVRRAGAAEPGKIRNALAATRDFAGATGPLHFNAHGDPVDKALSILEFREGKRRFVKTLSR